MNVLYHCDCVQYRSALPSYTAKFSGSYLQVPLLPGKPVYLWVVLLSKKVLLKIGGFDERLRRFQDTQFMLKFFDHGGIVQPINGLKVRINYDRDHLRLTYEEYKAAKNIFLSEIVQKNNNLNEKQKNYILDFHEFDLYLYRLRTCGLKYIISFKLKFLKYALSVSDKEIILCD